MKRKKMKRRSNIRGIKTGGSVSLPPMTDPQAAAIRQLVGAPSQPGDATGYRQQLNQEPYVTLHNYFLEGDKKYFQPPPSATNATAKAENYGLNVYEFLDYLNFIFEGNNQQRIDNEDGDLIEKMEHANLLIPLKEPYYNY